MVTPDTQGTLTIVGSLQARPRDDGVLEPEAETSQPGESKMLLCPHLQGPRRPATQRPMCTRVRWGVAWARGSRHSRWPRCPHLHPTLNTSAPPRKRMKHCPLSALCQAQWEVEPETSHGTPPWGTGGRTGKSFPETCPEALSRGLARQAQRQQGSQGL